MKLITTLIIFLSFLLVSCGPAFSDKEIADLVKKKAYVRHRGEVLQVKVIERGAWKKSYFMVKAQMTLYIRGKQTTETWKIRITKDNFDRWTALRMESGHPM